MTVEEFDIQFDIFYNNIASNAAPSVDTYEKSVFLTKAQNEIVIELYSGRAIPGLSFESTEEARTYLRELISEYTYEDFKKGNKIFSLPEDLMFILTEKVKYNNESPCISKYSPLVIPKRLDYLQRDLKNPFRGPSKDIVLRVDKGKDELGNNKVELYSIYDILSYTITYLRSPKPIDLNYNEETKGLQGSELNPILHEVILDRAVTLAKEAYIGK